MPRTLRYSTQLRPLVNRKAVSGVVLATVLGWCGLLLLASERQELAASALPSALSLRLLELGLATRPDDDGLRIRLARKRLEAGQLLEARELVQRVVHSAEFRDAAQALSIDIAYARWTAVDPQDRAQRADRLEELHATLDAVAEGGSSEQLRLRIAALYRETERPERAAVLLDNLARGHRPLDVARFAQADAAWLEAGQPLAAADLQAFLAAEAGTEGPTHARLALQRAQLSGNAQALASMLQRMRALYPQDVALLKLAITIAEASDVRRACDLAIELARLQPGTGAYHREAARLAEASGRSLCALDQYMWLWRHEHRAQDKLNALRLARANWDLELLRELLDGTRPVSQTPVRGAKPRKGCGDAERRLMAAEWEERFRLYEALGDTSAARALLTRVVGTPEGNTQFWWRRKLELDKRLDDHTAAIHTLTQMLARFPERGVREELAELQLAVGQSSAALATLEAAPATQRDGMLLRRTCEVAAAVGNLDAERAALEQLTRTHDATLWDYHRLLALAPDAVSAAQIASEACWRFQSYDMFYVALQLYGREGHEAAQLTLIEQVTTLAPITRRVDYWLIRIHMQQALAARAAEHKDYRVAKAALENADDLLRNAAKLAPSKQQYAALWDAQHAQALSVGLQSGDKTFALRAFLATQATFSVRERVYLLIKLGQTDKALEEARRELERTQLRDSDRSVLQNDALSLSRGRATDLQLMGQGFSMPGLQAFGGSARVDYAEIAGGLRASVDFTEYQPVTTGVSVLGAPVRDMTAALRGRLSRFTLELGALVRDTEQVRPFGMLQLRLAGDEERGAGLALHGNSANADTARMRVLGVTDAVAFKAVVGLAKHIWASARAAGEMYYTRTERHYLGWGATVDLSMGGSWELPAKVGNAGVRVFGRGAPRFAAPQDPRAQPDIWLPATSVWSGVGVSLARGQLDAPVLFGKDINYGLDVSFGWLMPVSAPGWSITGQLGVSVFGADSLTLAATAGNVLGASGFAGSAGYVVSFAD